MLNQSVVSAIPKSEKYGHAMRGVLKLFTEVQVAKASQENFDFDRKVFKRVTLATYYGVKSDSNLDSYVKTLIELNPALKHCHVHYEYVIREFG